MSPDRKQVRLTGASSTVITGRGLVCSLGLDVVTACAAYRAGLTRPSTLDQYRDAGDTPAGAPLFVHAAPGITHGFVGLGRLVRLVAAALADLQRQTPDSRLCDARVGYFVALPAPGRTSTGAAALLDEAARAEREEEARSNETPSDAAWARLVLHPALSLAGLSLPSSLLNAVTAGHASVGLACLDATKQLAASSIDLAVIIAVDSLLDTATLAWLESLERLRIRDRPAGVIPGEACAVLLLESQRRARERKARVFGKIEAFEVSAEPNNILSGQASTGLVLAELIAASREDTPDGCPWLILDHNGENARAAEWGNTLFHLARRGHSKPESQVWFPAVGFGDTAAASGAIASCVALAAWERNYAPGDRVIVCSVSDGPPRTVMRLAKSD